MTLLGSRVHTGIVAHNCREQEREDEAAREDGDGADQRNEVAEERQEHRHERCGCPIQPAADGMHCSCLLTVWRAIVMQLRTAEKARIGTAPLVSKADREC